MKILKSFFIGLFLLTVVATPSFAFTWSDIMTFKSSTEAGYTPSTAWLKNTSVDPQAFLATGVCGPHLLEVSQSNGRVLGQLLAFCVFGTAPIESSSAEQNQVGGAGGLQIFKTFGFEAGIGSDAKRGGLVTWLGFNPISSLQSAIGAVQPSSLTLPSGAVIP
jgi:hypothetical protein